jgi:HEPN domain-containing protein
MKKTKIDLVKNWLEKARRDLVTAKNSLDSSEPFADIICFHTQQAGEKYIKAYLVWREIDFPWTHSLEDLLLLASKADSAFTMLISDANLLTPYAVEVRYGESDEPLITDAKKAIEIAKQIRDFVLDKLPDEVKSIPENNSSNIKRKNTSI